MQTYAACGVTRADDARLCPACGAGRIVASARRRETVSIVFVDLVGSAARARAGDGVTAALSAVEKLRDSDMRLRVCEAWKPDRRVLIAAGRRAGGTDAPVRAEDALRRKGATALATVERLRAPAGAQDDNAAIG